ncbi:MAG: trypsin-like peptidase domain-containing protein [Thermoguttaceae bacterium]|nr:trypsin-like peptidase domain-containing protein [Thermoguttaceae bacterium]
MEKKIRKRYKRARASWKRAAAKSAKASQIAARLLVVAFALAELATSWSVASESEPAQTPEASTVAKLSESGSDRRERRNQVRAVARDGSRAVAAAAWNMEDLHRSSCRVVGTSGGNATQIGSGLTVGELENDYVVKTNAHVVDGCKSFVVQYFGDGAPVSVDARPDRKFYDSRKQYDEAFLTVKRDDLDGYVPPLVPLAPSERAQIDPTRPIYACGCPGAREPQAWVGRTIGEFGRLQTFKPAPLQGQSGSGIVQRSPEGWFECRATLTYRSAETAQNFDFDAAHGLAIPVKFLYEAASGRVVDFSAPVPEGIIPLRGAAGRSGPELPLELGFSAPVGCFPVRSTSADGDVTDDAASPRYEPAVWVGDSDAAPLAFEPTRPLLLYFSAKDCGACRRSTPVVEEFARKGWPVKALDVETSEGGRAWRAYRFNVVPAFAFVEIDAAGQYVATLDAWVGADCRERIASNFKRFKSRPRPAPRPKIGERRDLEPTAIPVPTPLVACRFELPNEATAQTTENAEKTQVAEAAESPTLATDSDEPPIDASKAVRLEETPQASKTNDLPTLAFEFGEALETSETSTLNEVGEPSAEAEKASAETLGDAAEPVAAFETDAAPPKTVDDLLKRYERGWTPPFRDAVPDVGAENDGDGKPDGSTDSTAGLIGGAVERAAREKVEALAAELEKAARERIDAVAGELETAARAKAAALAAEVEEAARTEIDELSLAVAMSATALIGSVEQEATAKLETAVDGLKRRAGAALAAVGVWGAFAAGAWYWLVRLLAKCWGNAPKYRLVRDEGTPETSGNNPKEKINEK